MLIMKATRLCVPTGELQVGHKRVQMLPYSIAWCHSQSPFGALWHAFTVRQDEQYETQTTSSNLLDLQTHATRFVYNDFRLIAGTSRSIPWTCMANAARAGQ